MAQNKIDSTGTSVNTAKFFFYIKGSKDYPADQIVSEKFGYNIDGSGESAQNAIFDTSIKDLLIRTTNPRQIDNLYSLYSDSGNAISIKDTTSNLNVRTDRSQEYLSSMIIDNGKVTGSDVNNNTRFVDHINPNYTRFGGKDYSLSNVIQFKTEGNLEDNVYALEPIFWQKIFTICEFIKKYESEILDMYADSSKKVPSFIQNASTETLNTWYGSSENVARMKSDLETESELGRFLALFIGKCTDNSKTFQTRYETGNLSPTIDEVTYKYNPIRWKELTGQESFTPGSGDKIPIEMYQEMFWSEEVLNMQYVVGSANFDPSTHERRIKKVTFQIKADYTTTISKTWNIVCYLDPDAFVNSSSISQFAVYTYNDTDMDGVVGADGEFYGIYDNDYANVTASSPTVKNNFVSSQSEFQLNVIKAIADIMKDGIYKQFTEFRTMRVTPVIGKDVNGNNTSEVIWDPINNSIDQTFYIFYGSDASAPTASQEIAAVKNYIKDLHSGDKCHPEKRDENGNVISIGHDKAGLDQFLANMYPNLFTLTEVYIIPTETIINPQGNKYDPHNYFGTSDIQNTHIRMTNLGGIFSVFKYSENGSAEIVVSGDRQVHLPIEYIHVGSIAGELSTGQDISFTYPMPLICTSFNTNTDRPLTSLSGFANYQQKIFSYNSATNYSYADKLQIVLIKLMEAMFTEDSTAPYFASISGVPIVYEIDRNADESLPINGLKKNVAKFVINNVNFTVIAHKGKLFAKNVTHTTIN